MLTASAPARTSRSRRNCGKSMSNGPTRSKNDRLTQTVCCGIGRPADAEVGANERWTGCIRPSASPSASTYSTRPAQPTRRSGWRHERFRDHRQRARSDLVVGVDVADDVAFDQRHALVHGVVHPVIVRLRPPRGRVSPGDIERAVGGTAVDDHVVDRRCGRSADPDRSQRVARGTARRSASASRRQRAALLRLNLLHRRSSAVLKGTVRLRPSCNVTACDRRRPILVTGSHRSGTGWVGKHDSGIPAHRPSPTCGNRSASCTVRGSCEARFDRWFPYVCERERRPRTWRPSQDMLDVPVQVDGRTPERSSPKDAARLRS